MPRSQVRTYKNVHGEGGDFEAPQQQANSCESNGETVFCFNTIYWLSACINNSKISIRKH